MEFPGGPRPLASRLRPAFEKVGGMPQLDVTPFLVHDTSHHVSGPDGATPRRRRWATTRLGGPRPMRAPGALTSSVRASFEGVDLPGSIGDDLRVGCPLVPEVARVAPAGSRPQRGPAWLVTASVWHPGRGEASRGRSSFSRPSRRRRRGSPRSASLSGTFAGCVHAGRTRHGQLSGQMKVTVIDRSVPWLTLRYGTRMVRGR
jgi:hypothetical protein